MGNWHSWPLRPRRGHPLGKLRGRKDTTINKKFIYKFWEI
jgi:hypothetical protein